MRPGHRRLVSEPVRWRPAVSSPLASSSLVFTAEPESLSPVLDSPVECHPHRSSPSMPPPPSPTTTRSATYASGSRSAHTSPDSSDEDDERHLSSSSSSSASSPATNANEGCRPRRIGRRRRHKRSASFGDLDIGYHDDAHSDEDASRRPNEGLGLLGGVFEEDEPEHDHEGGGAARGEEQLPEQVPTIAAPPPYAAMRLKPSFDFALPPIPYSPSSPFPGQHLTVRPHLSRRARRTASSLPRLGALVLLIDAGLSMLLHLFLSHHVLALDRLLSPTVTTSRSSMPGDDFFTKQTPDQMEPLCAYARSLSPSDLDGQWSSLLRQCPTLGGFSKREASHVGIWMAIVGVKALLGYLVLRTSSSSSSGTESSSSTVGGVNGSGEGYFDVEKSVLGEKRASPPQTTTAGTTMGKAKRWGKDPALAYLLFSASVHFILGFLAFAYFSSPSPFPHPAPLRAADLPPLQPSTWKRWTDPSPPLASPTAVFGAAISTLPDPLISTVQTTGKAVQDSIGFLFGAVVGLLIVGAVAVPTVWVGRYVDAGLSRLASSSNECLSSSAAAVGRRGGWLDGVKLWWHDFSDPQPSGISSASATTKAGGRWEEGLVLVEGAKGFRWEKRRWWVNPVTSPSSSSCGSPVPSLA